MGGAMLLVAAITTGIDAGWQPLPDGGVEYIIQIEPHALESLSQGREIVSDIPSSLRGIKSYRIRVGTGPLPREEPREPSSTDDLEPLAPADVPRPLVMAPDTTSGAERLAAFNQQEPSPSDDVAPVANENEDSSDQAASAPWMLFSLGLAAFFGFGGTLYTGWIAWDYRRRYRELLEQMTEPESPPS